MKLILAGLVLLTSQSFAQFPSGKYFANFGDKGAVITIDSVSISLSGGTPVYDQVGKKITLDSAEDGQKVEIVKMYPSSGKTWRVLGKIAEPTRTIYAMIDLIRIDKETVELNFNKDEYTTVEEADAHLKDSGGVFGFQLITDAKIRRLMSLRPLQELTGKDLISVYQAIDDSMKVIQERTADQPELAMFIAMTRPMQIAMDELAARGYNPLMPKDQVDAIIEKLREDPEVKKALDERQPKEGEIPTEDAMPKE